VGHLDDLAALVRDAPALADKRELAMVRRLDGADGDDAALVRHGDGWLVLCAEAIAPAFCATDPFGAGAACVATNVADVRAMGGTPIALVDTVVSPDRAHAERVLDGIAWASRLFGVPVVGGHLTIGAPAAVSAACTGTTRAPLRASAAAPGDVLLAAFCTEGEYRAAGPYFSSLRIRDPELLRTDGEAIVAAAEAGLVHAARDVSMPGVAGSLLQMIELAGCGATLDLDRLPRPPGVPLERWLLSFPSFGFVFAAAPGAAARACALFTARGLACAPCGSFDEGRVLRLTAGGVGADVWDLGSEPLTGLG
jgi:selenophosphate synthetase-related protein